MSTMLKKMPTMLGDMVVTAYFAGKQHGKAIQLTQGLGVSSGPQSCDTPGFVQLSRADVEALIPILEEWLGRQNEKAQTWKTYRVTWEIHLTAHSPVDAAIHALQMQKNQQSTAKVFDVARPGEGITRVDLDALNLSLCDVCGATDATVGCPDGAHICQSCFDKGFH